MPSGSVGGSALGVVLTCIAACTCAPVGRRVCPPPRATEACLVNVQRVLNVDRRLPGRLSESPRPEPIRSPCDERRLPLDFEWGLSATFYAAAKIARSFTAPSRSLARCRKRCPGAGFHPAALVFIDSQRGHGFINFGSPPFGRETGPESAALATTKVNCGGVEGPREGTARFPLILCVPITINRLPRSCTSTPGHDDP